MRQRAVHVAVKLFVREGVAVNIALRLTERKNITELESQIVKVVIRSDSVCQIVNVCNRPKAVIRQYRKQTFNHSLKLWVCRIDLNQTACTKTRSGSMPNLRGSKSSYAIDKHVYVFFMTASFLD